MSLASRLTSAFQRVGTEFKSIRTLISGSGTGTVSGLSTTADNLVAAINEVKATADAASGSGGLSEAQVDVRVQLGVDAMVGGAPAALDTLQELADAVNDDANFAATVTAQLALKANASDVYTQAQLGDPETDLVAVFEAALT